MMHVEEPPADPTAPTVALPTMTSIATKQWRVGNASFLDAFVRAPRSGSDARARLVLVGIDVRMAGHGRGLSCLFANGETTEGEAAGSEEAGKDVHQAWSCPVPKQVYEHEVVAASGAAGSSTLSVTLIAANKKGDVDNESRRRRTIAVPMRPYLATRFANLRIGATAMVRNAVAGSRASMIEHIEYHRLLGFDHWFLYDNGSTDGTVALLKRYEEAGLVTTVRWPYSRWSKEGNNRVQRAAFNHAWYAFAHHLDWLAFIDLDEFLMLPRGALVPPPLGGGGGGGAVANAGCPTARASSQGGSRQPASCLARGAPETPSAQPPLVSYRALVLRVRDRASPKANDCGAGGSAHTRRIAGCRLQRASEGEPKVVLSLDPKTSSHGMPPPIISPHYFHCCRGEAVKDVGCMRVADEAELGLRHFSASTLHSNTCDEEDGSATHGGGKKRRGAASHADEGPACAMEHSLDWMQEPLTLRISAVVKASCVNASTAAAGSEQWLVANDTSAELFGSACLQPEVAPNVHLSGGGSASSVTRRHRGQHLAAHLQQLECQERSLSDVLGEVYTASQSLPP